MADSVAPMTWHTCRALLLCIILAICVFHVQAMDIVQFPSQWDLPSPMRLQAVMTSQEPVSSLRVRISIEDHDFTPQNECYVAVDNKPGLLQAHVVAVTTSSIQLTIDFEDQITVDILHLICLSLTINRPPGIDVAPSEIDVKVEISTNSNPPTVMFEESKPHVMSDQPTLQLDYNWTALDAATVLVTYTFYRPITLSDHSSFIIKHPLLDISQIKTMHQPSGEDPTADLLLPYNLLSQTNEGINIKCSGELQSSEAWITYSNEHDHNGLILDISEPIDNAVFICSFGVTYPPNVLFALLQHASSSPETVASITTTISPQMFTVPLRGPDDSIMAIKSNNLNSQSVRLWTSPHYIRDQQQEFEIGIATTDQQCWGCTVNAPSQQLAIMMQKPNSNDFEPSTEWSPQMSCRSHLDHQLQANEEVSLEDGIIDLSSQDFSGFGKVCRIRFTQRPSDVHPSWSLRVGFKLLSENVVSESLVHIMTFHALHQGIHTSYIILSIPPVEMPLTGLPGIMPIQFSHHEEDGKSYAMGTMNIQYLPSQGPLYTGYLYLVFVDQLNIFDILPERNADIQLRITTRGFPIYSRNNNSGYVIFANVNGIINQPDGIENIFQHGKPIRSPALAIVLYEAKYSSSQPLTVQLRFPIRPHVDIETIRVFPYLYFAQHLSNPIYYPHISYITPTTQDPALEYSYRCVTWQQMAGNYVYRSDLETTSPLHLTDANSFPCGQQIASNLHETDVSDSLIWRRNVYLDNDFTTNPVCFYELAAVCVTDSKGIPGAYDVHPRADCGSFQDEVHALPCTLFDNPPSWDTRLEVLALFYKDDPNINISHSLRFSWRYRGDPRLMLTLSVRVVDPNGAADERDRSTWVAIAYNIPVYLSLQPPPFDIFFYPPLPPFDPTMTRMEAKITLDGAPDLEVAPSTNIGYQPSPSRTEGCTAEFSKMFDPNSHLCVCVPTHQLVFPDATANLPLYTDANQFSCIERCKPGFIWNNTLEQCECDQNDTNNGCNNGVCNPSTNRCTCVGEFYGEYCENEPDEQSKCEQLECVQSHTHFTDLNEECHFPNDSTEPVCNCLEDKYFGDQCEHEHVCAGRPCTYGKLLSPNGQPAQCRCECNSIYISGSTCNLCNLPCRNGSANARCTGCQCKAGYIGDLCQIPVWYHSFTLRNLPQHIVEMILNTSQASQESLANLEKTMIRLLLEDYSRTLRETFIIVDQQDTDTGVDPSQENRIRVRVELSKFEIITPPTNPNAPYVYIQLMLYPADMSDEMLEYAQKHGLHFEWNRITDNLDLFKSFLREEGILDDNDDSDKGDLSPEITDPSCTTKDCQEGIIDDDDSSNSAHGIHTHPHLPWLVAASVLFLWL